MHVLFVTSEVAPLFKIGGLGDVSRSLPMALSRLGVGATIILPYYKVIKLGKPRCVGTLSVIFKKKRELVFAFAAMLPEAQVPILLLRHPLLERYTGADMAGRFGLFALATVALVRQAKALLGHGIDIVHCHDWHTALVPLVLGENNKIAKELPTVEAKTAKTILTIHNLLYQGLTSASLIADLGLPRSIFHILPRRHGETINVLREALEYADVISTVSPTYAREICTPAFGQGLDPVLRKRKESVVGILNGIEEKIWNPATDQALPVKYSLRNAVTGKKEVKRQLQKELALPVSELPLFGFIGRLEPRQKGLDILLKALAKLLPGEELQMVILGTGNPKLVSAIDKLAKRYQRNFAFRHEFNEPLAHRIYAAADVMLVPSKFEPCGLIQMIAMRYGALPLVRKTGGLDDSVDDRVNGFEFSKYSASILADKITEVFKLWQEKPGVWQKMMQRAMARDFSWTKSAEKYKKLYQKLVRSKM